MRKRSARPQFHEPSLVPLADMLTNTVGIMVFILIFTVLTAGGVVLVKRLPREHSTKADPVYFICKGGRLLPLDYDASKEQFLRPLGKLTSYSAVDGWIKQFNARQVEEEFFVVKGEGEANYSSDYFSRSVQIELVVTFMPRDGVGETMADLERSDSRFRQILSGHQPDKRFIYFSVYPDSLDLFFKARSIAVERMQFGYGWAPQEVGELIRFRLTSGSGGISVTPQ